MCVQLNCLVHCRRPAQLASRGLHEWMPVPPPPGLDRLTCQDLAGRCR